MRRLLASNHMTLDGFFEGPNREIDWFAGRPDEEHIRYSTDMLRSVDTLVFGRVTYDLMASYWPNAPKDEVAEKMNSLEKIVFSRTMKEAPWRNCRLVKSSAAEEISKLKQQPGKDMVILGSAALASSLLQDGLIDEYRILLNPILLGKGNPLFKGAMQRVNLKLENIQPLASGTVVLYYRCA